MTSSAGVKFNFGSLPLELQKNVCEQLTLPELFELNKLDMQGFEIVSVFINDYMEKEKYKQQSRLKDCMFLINFEEYRDAIYQYLYDLVSMIGINFVQDITNAGGSIHFMQLAQEQNPRNIYTIKIQLTKGTDIFEHVITSVGAFTQTNIVYYFFGYIDRPKNTRTISFDVNDIVNKLIEIVNIMKINGCRIKNIHYYRENYCHDFIRLKSPALSTTEGFHLF